LGRVGTPHGFFVPVSLSFGGGDSVVFSSLEGKGIALTDAQGETRGVPSNLLPIVKRSFPVVAGKGIRR